MQCVQQLRSPYYYSENGRAYSESMFRSNYLRFRQEVNVLRDAKLQIFKKVTYISTHNARRSICLVMGTVGNNSLTEWEKIEAADACKLCKHVYKCTMHAHGFKT